MGSGGEGLGIDSIDSYLVYLVLLGIQRWRERRRDSLLEADTDQYV